MGRLAVSEIRSHLSDLIKAEKEGASAPDIIAALRKKYSKSVIKASRELEDIALIKLISEAGKRAPTKSLGQPDLFSGYGVRDFINIPSPEKTHKRIHKSLLNATLDEAEIWLEHHLNLKKKISTQATEIQRMLDDIRPFAESGATTIEEALRAMKKIESEKTA